MVSATISGISSAITRALIRVALGHYSIDHGNRAADSALDRQRSKGAVLCTGPAFHTIVKGNYSGAMVLNFKDAMRTDLHAAFAAGTLFHGKFQCRNARYIRLIHIIPQKSRSIKTRSAAERAAVPR